MWLLAAAIFLIGCSPADGPSGPVFEDAWIREIPPGMKMTAGFGTLSNPGSTEIRIVSFSSPLFGDVSLHRTELVDGMSEMREVALLTIPAAGTVELAPGGYHLMLMSPSGEIAAGQMVRIEMTAADGRAFEFDLPVVRR